MATPYVISSDLVSAYPAKSLEIAQYIDGFKADLALVQNAQTGTTYSIRGGRLHQTRDPVERVPRRRRASA
jgi:hypothetical protein